MHFLGIDLGSSSVKASIVRADSNTAIASAFYPRKEMPMLSVQAGWAEQHPDQWWDAAKMAVGQALHASGLQKEAIRAIGISYQMHGLVCVDKDFRPLRPSIIWCDSRAVPYGEDAMAKIGPQRCLTRLLNSPGNFTAAKLAWVKENEPHIYNRIHKVMLPGDYLALRMSGTPQTTRSGLSEGIFYDFADETVSHDVMDHFGFTKDVLPRVVDTFAEQAQLSPAAAAELGLLPGTKITYRAGDQPNNALSLNVLNPGEIAATAGTSGVVYGITESLKPDPLSRVNGFAHVNHTPQNRRIGILLCINGAGILYAWAKQNLQVIDYEEMNSLAASVPAGSDGLVVLPFGNGAERILSNKNIGASFHHLHLNSHKRSHVLRAMIEGIAFSFRYGLDIMRGMDLNPEVIRAGRANMFQSKTFTRSLSAVSGAEIELYDTDGAEGAARGAGIGLGHYKLEEAFGGLELLDRIEPDVKLVDACESAYGRWLDHLNTSLR